MLVSVLLIIIVILVGILIGVIIKNKTVKYISWGILGCCIALFLCLSPSDTTEEEPTEERSLTEANDSSEYISNEELTEAGIDAIRNKDIEGGIDFLNSAAKRGYAPAQIHLGHLNFNGWGIPQNYETAFFWYLQAAEAGDAEGQFNVAEMYYYMEAGKDQHLEKAEHWASLAAAQGHEEAKILLEKIRRINLKEQEGENISEEYWLDLGYRALQFSKSLKIIELCFKAAAYAGSRDAMFQLGILHLRDSSLRDEELAEQFLTNALSRGDERAKEYLEELEERKKMK